MRAVLGIDAAWTSRQPSGVALLHEDAAGWRCVALAPSYDQFTALAFDREVDWFAPIAGSIPEPAEILAAAESLLGHESVSVIAADIPLATAPIEGRREADRNVSRDFGRQGCGTHSPTKARPGSIGLAFRDGFAGKGFHLATARTRVGAERRLIEVYPHPALLRLSNSSFRLKYKIGKSSKYWPSASRENRIVCLLNTFSTIISCLGHEVRGITLTCPNAKAVKSFSALKRYEDALDALVCAWVGVRYLQCNAQPYGDDTSAIWVPSSATLPQAGQRQ